MFWKQEQTSILTVLQTGHKDLVLSGDGRCDSPGYSAKYGLYTFMELDYNVVLHIKLMKVQSSLILRIYIYIYAYCIIMYVHFPYKVMTLVAVLIWRRRDLSEG